MWPLLKHIARWAAAIALIVIGLVLSIPGVPGPGILVILIGVFVLLPESRWLRKKYAALKRRYPWVFSPIEPRRARSARPTSLAGRILTVPRGRKPRYHPPRGADVPPGGEAWD